MQEQRLPTDDLGWAQGQGHGPLHPTHADEQRSHTSTSNHAPNRFDHPEAQDDCVAVLVSTVVPYVAG